MISNGAVWATLLGSNQIGRLDLVTHVLTKYPIPTANSEPTGITAGGGYIWFVERKGDNLGQLNLATRTKVIMGDPTMDMSAELAECLICFSMLARCDLRVHRQELR